MSAVRRSRLLLHITPRDAWEAQGTTGYRATSLSSEGFIHCSTPEQVLGPAHALFRGQANLVLLCIDGHRLSSDVVYEDCYEAGQLFPHIYGPINRDAVIAVVPFPQGPDGQFSLPGDVHALAGRLE